MLFIINVKMGTLDQIRSGKAKQHKAAQSKSKNIYSSSNTSSTLGAILRGVAEAICGAAEVVVAVARGA